MRISRTWVSFSEGISALGLGLEGVVMMAKKRCLFGVYIAATTVIVVYRYTVIFFPGSISSAARYGIFQDILSEQYIIPDTLNLVCSMSILLFIYGLFVHSHTCTRVEIRLEDTPFIIRLLLP